MLDHVFTDAIGALRDAFESALLERQAFEERFQADVLLGDLTWETSYSLPGEGLPPRVRADITPRLADLGADRVPLLVHRRALRRAAPHRDRDRAAGPAAGEGARSGRGAGVLPGHSPPIGSRAPRPVGPDRRDDLRAATSPSPSTRSRSATRAATSFDEATLKDGSVLDDHFAAMGGWIASTLVRLGDLKFEFLPAIDDDEG